MFPSFTFISHIYTIHHIQVDKLYLWPVSSYEWKLFSLFYCWWTLNFVALSTFFYVDETDHRTIYCMHVLMPNENHVRIMSFHWLYVWCVSELSHRLFMQNGMWCCLVFKYVYLCLGFDCAGCVCVDFVKLIIENHVIYSSKKNLKKKVIERSETRTHILVYSISYKFHWIMW